jgi:threonine 3-dehydrogenase
MLDRVGGPTVGHREQEVVDARSNRAGPASRSRPAYLRVCPEIAADFFDPEEQDCQCCRSLRQSPCQPSPRTIWAVAEPDVNKASPVSQVPWAPIQRWAAAGLPAAEAGASLGTMRALVKPTRGPGLEMRVVPIPEVRPDYALIRVKAAAVCGSDIGIYKWDDPWVRRTVRPGLVIGHEFCGVVAEVGSMVTEVHVGDFVTAEGHLNCGTCNQCLSGSAHLCPKMKLIGFDRDGAFAEYVAVPLANVVKLPPLPIPLAAFMDAFGNAVHTAHRVPLVNRNVLITGCGPIGLMVIALARRSGARTIIATDPSEIRRRLAATAGAHTILDSRGRAAEKSVRRQTEPDAGVDILLEVSGSADALRTGFSLLKPGGSAVLLGLPKRPVHFDFANQIVAKGITVYGTTGRLMYQTWQEAFRWLTDQELLSALEQIVTHRLRLEEFDRAFELMTSATCGKVVFEFDDSADATAAKSPP